MFPSKCAASPRNVHGPASDTPWLKISTRSSEWPRRPRRPRSRRPICCSPRDNHPDRFSEEERQEADERFQLITEAFNQLRDERSRQEYDRSLAKETKTPEEEARLYFKNAALREQSGEFDNALKLYYEAMRLQPNEIEYTLAAGRLLARDKSRMRQAADLFSQAIEKNPQAPDPYLELGAVYSKSGMHLRAKRVYESALSKLPNHPELKKRLAQIKDK